MKSWVIPLAVGTATGILSAWGVGGGTLLLLVMTLFLDVEQHTAQTINLLYFLPTAAVGLLYHRKNGLLERKAIRPAALWGTVAAVAGALLACTVDIEILRRIFGGYLLLTAGYTLWQNEKQKSGKPD